MRAVGIVGLGAMGSAIASNLLSQGFEVVVWNRSPERAASLQALGARIATSVDDALSQPVSISMLANDQAVAEVLNGRLAAAAGRTHICMASISPDASDRLSWACRELGVSYIAAPVLGRPEVAARGELNIVAAGPKKSLDQVQAVLDAVGSRTWHVGDRPRMANVFKVAVNYNIIHALHALGESVSVVEAQGGSAEEFIGLLTETLFGGVVHRGYGQMIATRSYWPAGFGLELGLKDLDLAASTASEAGVELPSIEFLRTAFESALQDTSLADADWSAIAEASRKARPTP